MGWLTARLGEQNTAIGAGILYMAALQIFPGYAQIIHAVAGLVGAGAVVVPQK